MKEKCNQAKEYQYPDLDIIKLEGIDIVTLSDSSNDSSTGDGFEDNDQNQGEWD